MTTPTCTLVTYNPPTIYCDQTLAEALVVFAEARQGELPVVDNELHLLGLLTLENIFAWLADPAHADRGDFLVSELPLTSPMLFSTYEPPWPPLACLLQSGQGLVAVGDDTELEGVITRADFLEEFSRQSHPLAAAPVVEHVAPAGELVEATTGVEAALQQMPDHPRAFVAVAQGGLPLGAVKRLDLVRRLGLAQAERRLGLASRTQVSLIHALSSCPHLQPGHSMAEAARLMAESGAHVLLVANKAGRILGAMTDDKLLEALMSIRHAI